jgi:hypothetical protein
MNNNQSDQTLTENEKRVIQSLRDLRKRNRPTTLIVLDINGRGWYQCLEGVPMAYGSPARPLK